MISSRLLMVLLAGLWLGTLTAPAIAQSARAKATAGVDLEARLKQAQQDPKLSESLHKIGSKVAAVCANCHGMGGNSPKPDTPNLASQNPVYQLDQLREYASGQRRNRFMEGMIKALTSDEKVGMVLFYSEQKVLHKPVANAALVAKGKDMYSKACVGCHDQHGHGNESIARLAGQQPVYLHTAMKRYRAGVGARLNPDMAKNIQSLKDTDIDAVVAYVMSMD
jgi:cytochrome c553